MAADGPPTLDSVYREAYRMYPWLRGDWNINESGEVDQMGEW
jgi:hypothetical protein